ncbi:FeoA family protein [Mycolicibacterium fallax]|uniref:FeoA family protein n=1 Tax=Mycolicibacterium fallax TaxID=1793 RepID=UPI00138D3F4D|nr:FeoA family protein [Mycolicibacterium fallax]BBY98475.1 hypothetical protein MFAL_19420 [Mycolicibacterium fallax]
MSESPPAASPPAASPPAASPPAAPFSLTQLKTGSSALIVGLSEDAPVEVTTRLRHLGFRAGNVVEARRRAPLRDPVMYRLLGYDMCLRANEACHVSVVAL